MKQNRIIEHITHKRRLKHNMQRLIKKSDTPMLNIQINETIINKLIDNTELKNFSVDEIRKIANSIQETDLQLMLNETEIQEINDECVEEIKSFIKTQNDKNLGNDTEFEINKMLGTKARIGMIDDNLNYAFELYIYNPLNKDKSPNTKINFFVYVIYTIPDKSIEKMVVEKKDNQSIQRNYNIAGLNFSDDNRMKYIVDLIKKYSKII